jgi:ubiquinone/menaquinone biosynthesis C-methylase UbiE
MEVSEFKTAAWQSKQAAELYHSRTAEAHLLFQLIRHDLFVRYVQRFASPGAKILDLGCGSGLLANALYDLGYNVVACDVSQAMLDQLSASLGGRNIELRLGNGFEVPGRDGEFDAVVSRMFLQHFPEWPQVLKEKARVTRANGIVLFDFGNREHLDLSSPSAKYGQEFPYNTDLSTPAKYYAVASEQEMRRAAEECGLEVEAIIPHGFLLNNLHFWGAVGSRGVEEFNSRVNELLKDEKARALLMLIEESFLPNLPKHTSYGNITVLRRNAVTTPGN